MLLTQVWFFQVHSDCAKSSWRNLNSMYKIETTFSPFMSSANRVPSCKLVASTVDQMYFYRNPESWCLWIQLMKIPQQFLLKLRWFLTEVDDSCHTNRRFFWNNFRSGIECKHFEIRLRNKSFIKFQKSLRWLLKVP